MVDILRALFAITAACCQAWSAWNCSVSCGQGILSRSRSCFGCQSGERSVQVGTCFIPTDQCESAIGMFCLTKGEV